MLTRLRVPLSVVLTLLFFSIAAAQTVEAQSGKGVTPYCKTAVCQKWYQYEAAARNKKAKAGLEHKGYTLHCLRHTNASALLNAGMPLECLKELLGHTSVEVTRRYASLPSFSAHDRYEKGLPKSGCSHSQKRIKCESGIV
jgi:integrase